MKSLAGKRDTGSCESVWLCKDSCLTEEKYNVDWENSSHNGPMILEICRKVALKEALWFEHS